MNDCCTEIETGLAALLDVAQAQAETLVVIEFAAVSVAFAAWMGVGYLCYRLMVRRNWRLSS